MIYIVTFILTASFLYAAGKCKDIWMSTLVVIGSMPLCALAGFGDGQIGINPLAHVE